MFIVDMMQKFELCYELPDRPNVYLIPDLLPKEEPDTGTWSDALRFEVHYSVLPGSILTRLIVRMHRHIQGRTVWRAGVLLACDGNEALVKVDLVANRISIAVRGSALGRRELLTRIREHLEAIHASLAGLETAEKVPVPGHPEIPSVDYQWLRECERRGVPTVMPQGVFTPLNVRELLAGVDTAYAWNSPVLTRLRATLLDCPLFAGDHDLHTLFIDPRIEPWRHHLPDNTPSRQARVNALIEALLDQHTTNGDNALVLFLHVLAEITALADALHARLIQLAAELEAIIAKRPARPHTHQGNLGCAERTFTIKKKA